MIKIVNMLKKIHHRCPMLIYSYIQHKHWKSTELHMFNGHALLEKRQQNDTVNDETKKTKNIS